MLDFLRIQLTGIILVGVYHRNWKPGRCCLLPRSPQPGQADIQTPQTMITMTGKMGRVVKSQCYSEGLLL